MSEFIESELVELTLPDARLPNPDNLSYYILEKERKIYLETGICPDVLTIQRMIFRWNMEDRGKEKEARKPITIYIMSYGGDLDYMWTLVDTIKLSTTPITTVNVGVAASAASLIFVAGHRRLMMPNAKVIIHEGSASVQGDAVKVVDATESYKKELKRMKEFILEQTRIPATTLNRRKNNDWTIDAHYCLANGVCDQVIESLDDIL